MYIYIYIYVYIYMYIYIYLIIWIFRGPLFRDPLIISLSVLVEPYLAKCLYTFNKAN